MLEIATTVTSVAMITMIVTAGFFKLLELSRRGLLSVDLLGSTLLTTSSALHYATDAGGWDLLGMVMGAGWLLLTALAWLDRKKGQS